MNPVQRTAQSDRVEWFEQRASGELYLMIAELKGTSWAIDERSTYETSWFPAEVTKERLQRIAYLLSRIQAPPC